MEKPQIDLSECTGCEVCAAASPTVFEKSDLGFMEVVEKEVYVEEEILDAIRYCPAKCISIKDRNEC